MAGPSSDNRDGLMQGGSRSTETPSTPGRERYHREHDGTRMDGGTHSLGAMVIEPRGPEIIGSTTGRLVQAPATPAQHILDGLRGGEGISPQLPAAPLGRSPGAPKMRLEGAEVVPMQPGAGFAASLFTPGQPQSGVGSTPQSGAGFAASLFTPAQPQSGVGSTPQSGAGFAGTVFTRPSGPGGP